MRVAGARFGAGSLCAVIRDGFVTRSGGAQRSLIRWRDNLLAPEKRFLPSPPRPCAANSACDAAEQSERTEQQGTMYRAPTGERCEHDAWRCLSSHARVLFCGIETIHWGAPWAGIC